MIDARHGWNAAQRAAEREPKKPRELHPTMGLGGTPINPMDPMLVLEMRDGHTTTCRACGFHVHAPTCPTQHPAEPRRARKVWSTACLAHTALKDGKRVVVWVGEQPWELRASDDATGFERSGLYEGHWTACPSPFFDGADRVLSFEVYE